MFRRFFERKLENNFEEIKMPMDGKVIQVEEIPDNVFASKMLGDGVGIIPKDNTIYSPVNGEIIELFETKHGMILKSQKGTNILIHIGIDTVSLKGKPFTSMIKTNDKIKEGQPLIKVDFKIIEEAGLSPIVALILVDEKGNKKIKDKMYGDQLKVQSNIFTVEQI